METLYMIVAEMLNMQEKRSNKETDKKMDLNFMIVEFVL
jgi:hypothetical protein